MKHIPILLLTMLVINAGCQTAPTPASNQRIMAEKKTNTNNPYYSRTDVKKLNVSDAEWKKILPADVYHIAREKGTEYAFSGKYWDFEGLGNYYCIVCGNPLFKSDSKFASGCGWPSFYEPLRKNNMIYIEDRSHGMIRTEVQCARCESHLGHIFDDGPPPTGKRYCINSIVIEFEPDKIK